MRILIFIGFLILYTTYVWVANLLLKRMKNGLLENKTFWITELSILLGIALLFAFIFMLSGYFNIRLIGIFFCASQFGIILTAILAGLLSSPSSKWGPRALWAGGEFGLKHAPLMLGIMISSILIFLAYPVASGISYFSLPKSMLTERIFQYTLSFLFLGNYLISSFMAIGIIVSENIDEDTRIRYLINNLSYLVFNALYVALLFWSFNIVGIGPKVAVGSALLEISPLLIGLLIGFFVLTVLIPYLIGAQRAKRWRIALLEKRQSRLEKLENILGMPMGSLYGSKLAGFQNDLSQEIEEFAKNDQFLSYGAQIDQGNIPALVVEIAPAYKLTRDIDPRFSHLDSLRQIFEETEEISTDLCKLTTDMDLEKAAKEWINYLHPRRVELGKELNRSQKTHTPAVVIFSTILVPILSALLSAFASWLSALIIAQPAK
jgi:hypothetical protein